MRLNRGTQIVILLAALAVSGIVVRRFKQNRFDQPRVGASHVPRNQAPTVQNNRERFASSPASLANLHFTHLSVADGLSQSDVRAIVQDRQGFMWFGTWLGGLNRYDGYTFKVYKHDDQDDRSLSSDTIWALHVDRKGVLWVGTNDGVDRYDRDTDSFVHYRRRLDDSSGLRGYQARSFAEDENGALWVVSFGGPSRFDRTHGRFLSYWRNPNDPPGLGPLDLRSICLDKTTGLLWLGTLHQGVIALDPSSGRLSQYKNDPTNPASLSNNDVAQIFQDRKGILWFATAHGLNRFDSGTRTFHRYLHEAGNPASLGDDYVTGMDEDREGRFWVGTNNGLHLMDRDRATFTRYLHDPGDGSSLSSNVINWSAMYTDASGALWMGTRSAGVGRLAGEAAKFTTYRHNPRGDNGPSGDAITALAAGSAGAVWIGTEAGLDRFDGQTFTQYPLDPNDRSGLSSGPERTVVQDFHGTVWTGTYGGGLDRLDGGRVTRFRHDPKNSDSPASNSISSMVPDARGGLWIGVHGSGLDYFDGRHFTHFTVDTAKPDGLPGAFVRPMLIDAQGILWIAAGSWGLVRLDTRTRKFTTYPIDPKRPSNPAVNATVDVYSDGSELWVAAPTGLFRFDPDTGKFTRHYTERDGLAGNSVVGILGDGQGNLWVSTSNGLSRFDPRTETFRNYDIFDGLQGNEFATHCRAKASDGRLFFGGVNGLSAFYPDKLVDNSTPPPVVLTDFELFNKPVKIGVKDSPLQKAISVASSITLRHDQSVFRFQFAALDYTAPQKNRYAYKLEGFDQDWRYTDAKSRFATYTNLDQGDYTFRVKASNNDGVWNEEGAAVRVTILPPWWKTNWFRGVGVAVLGALVWILYRARIRELEEREKKFREAVDSMPALAFVSSPGNERIFVNKRWVEYTGLTVEQAAGSGWQAAIHCDDLGRVLDKWRTAVTTGEPMDYEVRLRHAVEGEYRWFHTRVVPLRDNRGRIVKWCGIATDIEDRKRAEQERERLRELESELAHINRVSMMGELAASVAHEVNQPLTGIVSNGSACLRLLAGDAPNVEEVREAVGDMVRDGKRAGDVILRIRAMTKRAAMPKERLDLEEVIQEVLVIVADEARKMRVAVRTQFAGDLAPVSGDRVQLQQVVLNLVMNAMEAMSTVSGRPRELVIHTRNADGGQVEITVGDSGVGLDPNTLSKIFEPFYTTKPSGMGMGLSICRSIVQNHGGRLWATANDGAGTTFHFTLPQYHEEEQDATARRV